MEKHSQSAEAVCDFCRDPSLTAARCSGHLWPDGDLLDTQVDDYTATLIKVNRTDISVLCQELHLVASANFLRRLRVILEVLTECDIDLSALCDADGGTALLTALKKNNTEAALLLIEFGGKKLIMIPFTGEAYAGLTALHLAVVNGNRDVVRALLGPLDRDQRKTLIHSQPTGTFSKDNFMVSCLMLSVSHWCRCKAIFSDMIEYGAELDAKEVGTGSTVVHCIVRYGNSDSATAIEMLEHVLHCEESKAWWCRKRGITVKFCSEFEMARFRKYLLKIKDNDGFTPLTLSAKLGIPDVLVTLINMEGVYKFTDWLYGSSSMARFEMDEIDGILCEHGNMSVLDLIQLGSDDVLPAFNCPAIRRLSDAKWNYTWVLFTFWFVYHLVVMAMYTAVAVCSPLLHTNPSSSSNRTHSFLYLEGNKDIPRFCAEIVVTITAAFYAITETIYFVRTVGRAVLIYRRRGRAGYFATMGHGKPDIFRILNRMFATSTLVWAGLRIAGSKREDIAMGIGLTTGWYFVLFFSRAIKQSAFFTVMIHRMLFGDLVRFFLTFSALLIGFGTALMVMYMGSANGLPAPLSSFDQVLLTMFRLLIGLKDFDLLGDARSPMVASLLYIAFVCLGTLLLLNMVIAAMSDTYAVVSNKADLLFLKYRLVSIFYLENSLPCLYRTRYMVSKYMTYNDHAGRWELVVEQA